MWRMCVRTVLVETTSSDAISDAVRLLGRYLTTRSSASLSSSRNGAPAPPRAGGRRARGRDPRRGEVARQVPDDAELGVAELVAQRRPRAAPRSGAAGQRVEDRRD